MHQRDMNPQRVTVWCDMVNDWVIGSYFFENGEGDAVTVNGERYRYMIDTFLRPVLNDTDNS